MSDKTKTERRRFGCVLTILPHGGVALERSPADSPPTLKHLQDRVLGYIESVDAHIGGAHAATRAYVNEDGLFGLAPEYALPNCVGTLLTGWHEPLVGPVVIEHGFIHEDETEEVCECDACTMSLQDSQDNPNAILGALIGTIRAKLIRQADRLEGTPGEPLFDPRPNGALDAAAAMAMLTSLEHQAARSKAATDKTTN